MLGKDLYTTWAPPGKNWTQFAKPALFVHVDDFNLPRGEAQPLNIPADIFRHRKNTAFIIDLPGATSVEAGLTMAKFGFQPVPLYNGIHEKNIGGLFEAVNNEPIINALHAGGEYLRNRIIEDNALPAFLLDYDRNRPIANNAAMYDNRWTVELEDMPAASYMRDMGIEQVVLWTRNAINSDLAPILDSYRDMGIEVKAFCDETRMFIQNRRPVRYHESSTRTAPNSHVLTENRIEENQKDKATQDEVRKFENGRVALLLITIMGFINLASMFFFLGRPLLWTTPTITWLTYLWVWEWVGDAIAIWMTAMYLVLYLMSHKYRFLMKGALMFVAIETIVLLIYAGVYGFASYTGYSFVYGVIVFGFPVFILVFLIMGSMACEKLSHLSNDEFFTALHKLDSEDEDINERHPVVRRRHFRGFRGYGGYGGSGRGGYSGGGYRGGYGGGYGGGFGG
ncbi:MAG: DUF1390 domain-containing protein [Defluviitaleaceae bacterium]|nr:DUF1390 domain-containing protein [Defluviitaleaceae bacterium]